VELQSSPEYWSNLNQLCNLIEPRLNKAFRDALKNFNTHHGPILYLYRKGDMANAMHIHIRDGVRRHFAGLSWAHVVDESNSAFMLLIVGHALHLRRRTFRPKPSLTLTLSKRPSSNTYLRYK
jgi:hypothetical protein